MKLNAEKSIDEKRNWECSSVLFGVAKPLRLVEIDNLFHKLERRMTFEQQQREGSFEHGAKRKRVQPGQ